MRVGVITDIHANLPALQAALARIDEIGVDGVYCGGDLVGYGPHPNEVCRLAYIDQHDRELGRRSVVWTLEHSDEWAKDFMRGLPFDLRFELGGARVRLVHGSPRKVNEYLFENKPARTFERIAAGADCDVLVFGHTHKPWVHEYGGVLFVNCGSVGKPKDGDPRGAFAVLDSSKAGGVQATIERVTYDAGGVAREVSDAGLPEEYAERLVAAT
jgi:putative phosphoesterase